MIKLSTRETKPTVTALLERVGERLNSHRLTVLVLTHPRPFIVFFHLGLVALSSYGALWLRFDGTIPEQNWQPWLRALPWLIALRALTFAWFRLYRGLWRYTGIWDLRNILSAVFVSSFAHYLLVHWIFGWTNYPRAVIIIDAGILVLLMGGVRMIRRMVTELRNTSGGCRLLIYGAGDAGEMIVRDIRRKAGHDYVPVGFVDDDPAKVGERIHDVPVLGTRADLPRIISRQRPDEILLAIPRADPAVYRSVVRALERYNMPIKTLPTLRELLQDKVELNQIRNLSVQDLLSRSPVGLDPAPLQRFLLGRRVLVTGAGGSIGAELCRQIFDLGAETLVLFERHENSLYHIVNDLIDRKGGTRVHAVIGDVTDADRVETVLLEYRSDIIFHAAAHKHVPLMEDNACEAVKNNVTGTRIIVEAAERQGIDRVILISTDKAVNPTSVMGATKRVAELMLLSQGLGSGTSFIAVRFGNVLASAGSVVPRFLKQIELGGPVTVTHPEMRRYFMSIPEAVQLVLHAAAQGEGGKLYVLDMGEQINLLEMARALIRLAGFIPEVDIPITFIGLRPGEKLYEELTGPDEATELSATEKVMRVKPLVMPDPETLARERAQLEAAANRNDTRSVLEHLGRLVPAFNAGRRDTPASDPPAATIAVPPAATKPNAFDGALAFEHRCPSCGSQQVRRSRARSRLEEWRKTRSHKRPHRCHSCGWRGWLVPLEFHANNAVEELPPPNFVSIDESVSDEATEGAQRPVFSPRNLPRS